MVRLLAAAALLVAGVVVQPAEAQQRQYQQPRGIQSNLTQGQNRFQGGAGLAQPRPGQGFGGVSGGGRLIGADGGTLVGNNGNTFRSR